MEASITSSETTSDHAVQRQLVHALAANTRTAQLTAIGVGTVAALLLGLVDGNAAVLAWWMLIVGISLGRLAITAAPGDDESSLRQFNMRLAAGLAASGIAWGLLPFASGGPSPFELALCFIVIAGIGAGATTSLAPHRSLVFALLLPALGGLLASLAWYTPPFAGYLAATVLLYLLGMMTLHQHQHQLLRNTIATQLRLEDSLENLERNQADREALACRLQESSDWIGRYLAITNDIGLPFDSKTKQLMNLLRDALQADGIAFCRGMQEEFRSVHRMDSRGQLDERQVRCDATLLDGLRDEDGITQRRFNARENPLSRLFERDVQGAIVVRLVVEGQLFGGLVAAFRHAPPAGLRPVQRQLLDLVGSWLTMELIRHGAMERLQENRESIARIADSIPCFIAFIDADLRFRYVNGRYAAAMGIPVAELTGRAIDQVVSPSTLKLMQPFIRGALRGRPQEFELEALESSDPVFGGRVMKTCYTPGRRLDGSINGFYVLAVDITNDVEERRQLRDKSSRDPLTGLRNRAYFLERVRHEGQQPWEGQRHYLVALDVDGFKAVNDRFGELHGDRVLRQIADELQAAAGDNDMLARIGGDEFLLVVRDNASVRAEEIADSMIERINRMEIRLRGEQVHLGLSAGIARIDHRFGFKAAYRRADTALHASKQRGRNRCTVHFE